MSFTILGMIGSEKHSSLKIGGKLLNLQRIPNYPSENNS